MKDKVRVGMVGAGTWGENVVWAYSDNPSVELVAICDLNAQRAGDVAKQFGVSKTYKDYTEMLQQEKLDIVSVATPDFLHRKVVEDCASLGVDIFLEKPTATTVEDAEAIINVVEKTGIKFMTNYFMRWVPQFVEVKTAINRGELGEIVNGFAKIDDVISVPTKMLSWSKSSSPIFFIMIHNIDVVRWLLNQEVVEVYAKSQRKALEPLGYETDDAVEAMVTFENGATVVFESNWILPRTFESLVDHEVRLVGTSGSAYVDLTRQGVSIYTPTMVGDFDHPNRAIVFANEVHSRLAGCVKRSVGHFVDCVLKDKKPLVGLKDALEPTRIACAIQESIEKEKPIYL